MKKRFDPAVNEENWFLLVDCKIDEIDENGNAKLKKLFCLFLEDNLEIFLRGDREDDWNADYKGVIRNKEKLSFSLIHKKKPEEEKDNFKYESVLGDKAEKTIVLDIETTGFDFYNDDILQLSIVDGNGICLFDGYFHPEHQTHWERAEAVNGISPAMVEYKPALKEYIPLLQRIVDNAEIIVGYNSNAFDLPFIEAVTGISFKDKIKHDVMVVFSEDVVKEWNSYYGNYRNQKLTYCAEWYGYNFVPHNSLEDTRATLYCYKKMLSEGINF